jgi:hypothetical protein
MFIIWLVSIQLRLLRTLPTIIWDFELRESFDDVERQLGVTYSRYRVTRALLEGLPGESEEIAFSKWTDFTRVFRLGCLEEDGGDRTSSVSKG